MSHVLIVRRVTECITLVVFQILWMATHDINITSNTVHQSCNHVSLFLCKWHTIFSKKKQFSNQHSRWKWSDPSIFMSYFRKKITELIFVLDFTFPESFSVKALFSLV